MRVLSFIGVCFGILVIIAYAFIIGGYGLQFIGSRHGDGAKRGNIFSVIIAVLFGIAIIYALGKLIGDEF